MTILYQEWLTPEWFPYFGQVLGTSGVRPRSRFGKRLSGHFLLDNTIVWTGVPYVTGGTRTFRMTNIRANPSILVAVGQFLFRHRDERTGFGSHYESSDYCCPGH